MPPACILIGPPGAGKTTVGRRLADVLHLPFRDTDADIAERAGKSIAEIFVEDGEPIFRQFEASAVKDAIREHEGVLALGGGAVMDPQTQSAISLSGSPVVYLSVTITAASSRIGFNRDRPLLLVNPRAQWISLLEKRKPIYESLASVEVQTDEISPDQAVAAIRERIAL